MVKNIVIDQEEWRLRRRLQHCQKMVSFSMNKKASYMWAKNEEQAQKELDNYLASREVEENESI